MAGFGQGDQMITASHMRRAVADTDDATPHQLDAPATGHEYRSHAGHGRRVCLVGCGMSLVNDMLKDLEQRRVSAADNTAGLDGLQPVAAPRAARSQALYRAAIVVILITGVIIGCLPGAAYVIPI